VSDKGKVLLVRDDGVAAAGHTGGTSATAELQGDLRFQDSDELRSLIAEGRERGFLTFEQIASTLEEVEVTKEQVRDLHGYLIEHGVDVIAQDGPGSAKEAKEAGRATPAKNSFPVA